MMTALNIYLMLNLFGLVICLLVIMANDGEFPPLNDVKRQGFSVGHALISIVFAGSFITLALAYLVLYAIVSILLGIMESEKFKGVMNYKLIKPKKRDDE